MLIPIGMKYTATLRGKTAKLVTCEECQAEYVYFVERTAKGVDDSPLFLDNAGAERNARRRAEQDLRDKLDTAVAVVPCPECGRVQSHMIDLARREKFGHRRGLAKVAIIAGGIFVAAAGIAALLYLKEGGSGKLIMSLVYGPPAGLAFAWGIAKWIRTGREAAEYDPNAEDRGGRLRRGREAAIPRAELIKQMAEWQTREGAPQSGESQVG
jgi:hypothetical protein